MMMAAPIRKPRSEGPVQAAAAARAPVRRRNAQLIHAVLQRKCACGTRAPTGTCEGCAEEKRAVQRKLAIGPVNDPLEREADRVADQVLASSARADVNRTPPAIQRAGPGAGEPGGEAPTSVHRALAGSGRPLDAPLRRDMEARFGRDFSEVRIHQGGEAARSARDVQALAYTVGSNIVFGAGAYAPHSTSGARLLAHELTHVVQQSGGATAVVRRGELVGGGSTAKDKERPVKTYAGPMPYTADAGGTVVPDTESSAQNCAGDSMGSQSWINWPHLGETWTVGGSVNWVAATQFVPAGCTKVDCSGVSTHVTRCKPGETDVIAFLYKWPLMRVKRPGAKGIEFGYRSDFHMVGRDAGSLPAGWHSKMDSRNKVVDIRDPLQSLYDAYPHTKKEDREISKLCFCCDPGGIKTR